MAEAAATTFGPKSLTPEQERAVKHPGSRVLVVASAGSGKTEVLTRRLARILSESRGESFRCLAVTYTVKASQELRRRIEALVAGENWRADTDTLHGFALDWLRQYGQCVDVPPNVVIYSDDADRAQLISDYLASLGLQNAVGEDELTALRPVLKVIDDHRTLHPGQDFTDDTEYFGVPMSELYVSYLDALDQAGGIDFPGMLTKFLEALEIDPWIGNNFRSLFRHVLVDEAQDLTPAQVALLRQLVLEHVAIFAVADDKQSINGFAGGNFENARVLVGESAVELTLPHNFRSSLVVLRAAEQLASHFSRNSVMPQSIAQAPPGELAVTACATPKDEALHVVGWLERLLSRGLSPTILATGEDPALRPEDIAVIGRTRWTLDPIIAELKARGVPHAIQVEASGFLATPEGRVLLDALAVQANPRDRPAKRRLFEELQGMDIDEDQDVAPALRAAGAPSLVPVAELLQHTQQSDGLDGAFAVLDSPAVSAWSGDAALIRSLWQDYRAATDRKHRNVDGFLRHVARSQRVRPTDPGVRVMTIHRVKGLEFRAVAVVGAREGTLPDYREQNSTKGLDAERRAFYVAMTRASRALLVTWPRHTQDRYGRTHVQAPSRFIAEAGI